MPADADESAKRQNQGVKMQYIGGIPVWGDPLDNAVEQIERAHRQGAARAALMADHHLGYGVPVGGVVAYRDQISPNGVGYDIACGNLAARLDVDSSWVQKNISSIMDEIWRALEFGIGRKNPEAPDHPLFDDDAWRIPALRHLSERARSQLGTIGSGNHYVDVFIDQEERVWVGVHFGSRGFGHAIATHYTELAGGRDSSDALPALLDVHSENGQEYLAAMELAGRYAYAGREWVVGRVASILGEAPIVESVHNHHNFAWREEHDGQDLWVVRKGATPAWPGQRGFVGATMAEESVILEGIESDESATALYSTIHGAGRMMSRTKAAGRSRWKRDPATGKRRLVRTKPGLISDQERLRDVERAGVELRGSGNDEAPRAYKRLNDVLEAHSNTVRIVHRLRPIGVAMAAAGEFDPYRD